MDRSITDAPDARHLLRSETRPRMAKADVRKPETDAWKVAIGRAIERTKALRGWNLDQFAEAVQRDARQCARWMDGTERPQLDAIFAVKTLRPLLVVALAGLAGEDVEVETTIRVRRPA